MNDYLQCSQHVGCVEKASWNICDFVKRQIPKKISE